jgi:hypothetical protein
MKYCKYDPWFLVPGDNQAIYWVKQGAGKTTYLLSASFCYGNGYFASYPDLT